jgi:hypothetical protein
MLEDTMGWACSSDGTQRNDSRVYFGVGGEAVIWKTEETEGRYWESYGNIYIVALCSMTPCSLEKFYQYFEGAHCFHNLLRKCGCYELRIPWSKHDCPGNLNSRLWKYVMRMGRRWNQPRIVSSSGFWNQQTGLDFRLAITVRSRKKTRKYKTQLRK